MQQTETSKLNLIEKDDVFSPDPLNLNAEKLADALGSADFGLRAERDLREKAVDGLEQRVTALEVHKIAVGVYEGSGSTDKNIQVGFTPIAVIVCQRHPNDVEACMLAVTGSFAGSEKIPVLTIVEGGFLVHSGGYNVAICGGTNHYIAFG